LGQRLQGEIKLRLQHEATIDKLRMENETLRQRVTELEREIGELRSQSSKS
jgi:cell division protein FtsB